MTLHARRRACIAAAIGLTSLASVSAQAASYYTITDLGALTNGSFLDAYALNDNGVVVGYGNSAGENRAFAWQQGQIRDLGVLTAGANSGATNINNAGTVVGGSAQQAVQWSASGQVSVLPALPGANYANAQAINQQGDVVGDSGGQAVVWQQGQARLLPTPLNNARYSLALGINDGGTIVGRTVDQNYRSSAVVWQNGQGTLLETPTPFTESLATDLNNHNQIVGIATLNNLDQAVLWENGQARVLDPIAGDRGAAAYDINDAGQVVGFSILPTAYEFRAVLWEHGETVDLSGRVIDAPGWSLGQAQGINASGQIVGWGNFKGAYRSFLLTPTAVPEVQTSVMWLMGLAGLGAWRARQRRGSTPSV